MNWNISAWSIRNPVPSILLFVVLVVLGLMAFAKLPITRFPNIDVPLISVSVTDPGVAPTELETQIAKRVEDLVANITGVKNVTSNLTEGNSTTLVEFRLEVDTQKALERRQGRSFAYPRRSSGNNQGTDNQFCRRGGFCDPDLRRLGADNDVRRAFLVRR